MRHNPLVTLRSTASRAGALRSTTTQTKGRDACIHAEVKEVVDERSEEHRLRDSQGPDYPVVPLWSLDSATSRRKTGSGAQKDGLGGDKRRRTGVC